MSDDEFSALVLEERHSRVVAEVKSLKEAALPTGEVTVRVLYSTLNYKDALILKGLGPSTHEFPHIPGEDFAGVVERSESPDFKPGDQVVSTGLRASEAHWGGYAQRARVKADWLVPLPKGLTAEQAMGIGTAGVAAMLAVMALERHGLTPDPDAQVVVTGAAGGLGSIAIAVLSTLGYNVAAATGRPTEHDYLNRLGASSIVSRAELASPLAHSLLIERWSGAVDAVGGDVLVTVLAAMRPGASVAACGLAGGAHITTSLMPFLLRGVNLLGIDSVQCAKQLKLQAWERLARDLPRDKLENIVSIAYLKDLPRLADKLLEGLVRGRMVINMVDEAE